MRILPLSVALSLMGLGVAAWGDQTGQDTQPPAPPSSETEAALPNEATEPLPTDENFAGGNGDLEAALPNEATEPLPADENFAGGNGDLIVAVMFRKENAPLSDGMMAYAAGDDIALPLEQFMFLIEFPIQVSKDGRRAEGWFIRENQHFSLNLDAGTVVSNGKSFSINKANIRVADGDLYVPAHLLSQWFPLEIKSNLRALEVTVTPRESIALDDRQERSKKGFGVTYMPRAVNPEHDTPYQMFTPPALDVNMGAGYSSGNGATFKTR